MFLPPTSLPYVSFVALKLFWEKMYYFAVLNRTISQADGTDSIICGLFYMEIFCILFTYLELIPGLYLLYKCNQYHTNLTRIIKEQANQYLISMAIRIWQISYQLRETNPETVLSNQLLLWSAYLRMALTFTALSFGVFTMLERFLATCRVADYETKIRRHYGWFLVLFMYVYALVSAYLVMNEYISRLAQFSVFLVANVFVVLGTIQIERINKHWFKIVHPQHRSLEYSLSERSQVADNIKSLKPFKMISGGITFFSIICVLCMIAEEYADLSMKNWMYIGYNYAICSYGMVLPWLMLAYNPLWQKETKRILNKYFNTTFENDCSKPIGILGNELILTKKEERERYFDQLNDSWNYIPHRASMV